SSSPKRAWASMAPSATVRKKSPRQYHCSPLRVQAIERGLQRRIRHLTEALECRLHPTDGREHLVGTSRIARIAPDHSARLLQVERVGEGCRRWDRHGGEEPVQILVLGRNEVPK